MPRMIDADKLIDDYNKSNGTISDLMELILDAAEEATLPNDPLTLDELLEMDGETVWVTTSTGVRPFVGIVDTELNIVFFGLSSDTSYGGQVPLNCYGEFWLAYRRKPEEGTT